jgi:hypothetical protein
MNGNDSAATKPERKNAIKRFTNATVYTMESGPVVSLSFTKQQSNGFKLYVVRDDESTLEIGGANIPRTEVIISGDGKGRRCLHMPIHIWTEVRDRNDKPFDPCVSAGHRIFREEMVEQWGAMQIALKVIQAIDAGEYIQHW